MWQNPSLALGNSLKATRRLSGVWRPAGRRAKPLRGIESPKDHSDSSAASFNLCLSKTLPEPAADSGTF